MGINDTKTKNEIMSLECLLIDEKGRSMQGTIRKFDVQHFKSIISEGTVYIMENFNVIPYKYKIVDDKYIIQINKWTNITETTDDNTKYTCQAKLVEIDTIYGWWYKACYDCKGGVKDYDGTFWCNQCGKNDQSPVPWYKLNAIVADETGSANFTIFWQNGARFDTNPCSTTCYCNQFK
uniref:Replication factor A C-terminal domain-containing protein n=1 Tax=Ananas comosus var. bracteatus TaxID=296719 RepID=A0A6V7PL49_ANACO|nr:unnamed protein product [Ananas comosus var. bracteatus]